MLRKKKSAFAKLRFDQRDRSLFQPQPTRWRVQIDAIEIANELCAHEQVVDGAAQQGEHAGRVDVWVEIVGERRGQCDAESLEDALQARGDFIPTK